MFIDGQQVQDPTTHPATKNMAASLAGLYDMQFDPATRDQVTYEEEPPEPVHRRAAGPGPHHAPRHEKHGRQPGGPV
ncbi:hypothetical protein CTI14_67760, partial [Methylobacterium radiotolerans]